MQSSRVFVGGLVDNKFMELHFRTALSLVVFSIAGATMAQTTGTATTGTTTPLAGSADRLDDAGEVQLQQSLNDIYNKYNSQIAGLQGQMSQLQSTGDKQCAMEAKQAESQAAQQESQAKMQALQQMLEPGAQTLGHAVDSMMKGAGKEKGNKEEQLNARVNECNQAYSASAMPGVAVPALTCTKSTASPNVAHCGTPDKNPNYAACRSELGSLATTYQNQLTELNKEISETGSAMDGLIGSGMSLAAAGIGGMMIMNQGKEMAGYLRDTAEGAEDLCKSQVAAQLDALKNQIAQLEAAKARDIMMANMMAEYQTKVRRENQVPTDTTPLENGTIGVDGAPETAQIPPIREIPMSKNGSGSSGGSGGGGSGSGGGAAAPPSWAFDEGGGFDGGSRLPDQPEASSYSGTAGNALNFGKATGGFGAMDGSKNGELGDRALASDGDAIGDGGLRVLLARASLVHTRHASTLLKSIDFDRLAKTQGVSPKPASLSPAGPN
jgi:Skp family chaperone for outer membrane proteins